MILGLSDLTVNTHFGADMVSFHCGSAAPSFPTNIFNRFNLIPFSRYDEGIWRDGALPIVILNSGLGELYSISIVLIKLQIFPTLLIASQDTGEYFYGPTHPQM